MFGAGLRRDGRGMAVCLEYFESLPPLNMIGLCPITYRDAYLLLRPGTPSDVIEDAFVEYATGYREMLRRLEWDA